MLTTYPTTFDFRAPDYNPSSGRFVSEDPIGFQSSDTNLYRMVSNTPTVFVDPTGQAQTLPVVGGPGLADICKVFNKLDIANLERNIDKLSSRIDLLSSQIERLIASRDNDIRRCKESSNNNANIDKQIARLQVRKARAITQRGIQQLSLQTTRLFVGRCQTLEDADEFIDGLF